MSLASTLAPTTTGLSPRATSYLILILLAPIQGKGSPGLLTKESRERSSHTHKTTL